MSADVSSQLTMDGRSQGGELLEYRLKQVEDRVKEVGLNVTELRADLSPILLMGQKMAAQDDAIVRAFKEIEDVRITGTTACEKTATQQAKTDGEFQKWFNRCAGMLAVGSVLMGLFGNAIRDRTATMESVVAQVPVLQIKIARMAAVNRVMLKRLGIDPDLVPDEPIPQ